MGERSQEWSPTALSLLVRPGNGQFGGHLSVLGWNVCAHQLAPGPSRCRFLTSQKQARSGDRKWISTVRNDSSVGSVRPCPRSSRKPETQARRGVRLNKHTDTCQPSRDCSLHMATFCRLCIILKIWFIFKQKIVGNLRGDWCPGRKTQAVMTNCSEAPQLVCKSEG